jgi:hypothetical protein
MQIARRRRHQRTGVEEVMNMTACYDGRADNRDMLLAFDEKFETFGDEESRGAA